MQWAWKYSETSQLRPPMGLPIRDYPWDCQVWSKFTTHGTAKYGLNSLPMGLPSMVQIHYPWDCQVWSKFSSGLNFSAKVPLY